MYCSRVYFRTQELSSCVGGSFEIGEWFGPPTRNRCSARAEGVRNTGGTRAQTAPGGARGIHGLRGPRSPGTNPGDRRVLGALCPGCRRQRRNPSGHRLRRSRRVGRANHAELDDRARRAVRRRQPRISTAPYPPLHRGGAAQRSGRTLSMIPAQLATMRLHSVWP